MTYTKTNKLHIKKTFLYPLNEGLTAIDLM